MKTRKNKKGISLIVLVITIIVMIILAAAIILAINNTSIIKRANEAVEKSDEAQIKNLANLGWAEAYFKETTETKDDDYYQKEVEDYLEENGVPKDEQGKYEIIATPEGVTVSKKEDPTPGDSNEKVVWTQTGTTVTNGVLTLDVGDYIDYKAGVEGYTDTNGWRVLGAEDGEILIVSANNVVNEFQLGSEEDIATAKEDFETGVSKLDAVCEAYGNGDKATGVRSINGDDVDRVAEYDKTTFTGQDYFDIMVKMQGIPEEQEEAMLQQFGGTDGLAAMDYGRTVTFSWDGTDYPQYSYVKEGATDAEDETITKSFLDPHSTFTWYDFNAKEWRTSAKKTEAGTIIDDEDTTKTATLTYDMAFYLGSDKISKEEDKAAYEMLIATIAEDGTETPLTYWLASPCAVVFPYFATFGLRAVFDGGVGSYDFVTSNGDCYGTALGVRAVVSLDSNIQLEPASDTSWTIIN